MRARRFDPEAIAYSAIENASRTPITRSELITILATGEGDPSHVRALFGDVSLGTLIKLAIAFGISDAALAEAYARARRLHAARQPDLDRFAAELGHVFDQDAVPGAPSSV
jgi:hypothetical protein